jgi:hypothetical protein
MFGGPPKSKPRNPTDMDLTVHMETLRNHRCLICIRRKAQPTTSKSKSAVLRAAAARGRSQICVTKQTKKPRNSSTAQKSKDSRSTGEEGPHLAHRQRHPSRANNHQLTRPNSVGREPNKSPHPRARPQPPDGPAPSPSTFSLFPFSSRRI